MFENLSQTISQIEESSENSALKLDMFRVDADLKVKLLGENLMVGDILIPLVSRKVTLKLISEFINSENQFASRIELIERVYERDYRNSSERLQRALDKNIMKLLSRTRSLLERSLWKIVNIGQSDGFYMMKRKMGGIFISEILNKLK